MSLALHGPLLAIPGHGHREPDTVAGDIRIHKVEFGHFDTRLGRIVDSRVIDVSKTPSFGWRLELRTPRPKVDVREEFVLPGPAQTWGVGPNTVVSLDRSRAVTRLTYETSDGALEQVWQYTPGDPKGSYVTRIYVEGELVREFRYVIR